MAIESVATARSPGERILPIDDVDRADMLVFKAKGIVALMRASASASERPPDDAIPGACFAVEEMLDELSVITNRKTAR